MRSVSARSADVQEAAGRVRLTAEHVGVTFSTNDRSLFTALDDVSLQVADGEFVSLIGPSGCGKSTLLNVLGGLLKPSSGGATVDGEPIRSLPRQVGYMFQKATLLPWMTIERNVGLPLAIQRTKDRRVVREYIDAVGLKGFYGSYPAQLSGGMRTRAELARLLVQDPEILLMDEPFGALDAQTRVLMQEEFLAHWSEHQRTVVLVTHDLHEALVMSDRILLMGTRPGRVVAEFNFNVPRPRHHDEVVNEVEYRERYSEIWASLKRQTVEATR